MRERLHLIWDMDGTLVNSESEIISTVKMALAKVGVSPELAQKPLRIGPPMRNILRNAFAEDLLSDAQLEEVVGLFRTTYDNSYFKETVPYEGIDEIMHDTRFVHHIITNKPDLPTRRIVHLKGWDDCVADVLTLNTLEQQMGRIMTKPEMFRYCKDQNPEALMVGIGDMASDCESAMSAEIESIGVLWGTGTREELETAGCKYIVSSVRELKQLLNHINEYNTI